MKRLRKINLIIITLVVAFGLIGTTYAFFNYYKVGGNQKLIAGQIYLNFVDQTDSLSLSNIYPETADEARARTDNVITFTVAGNSTSTNKDVYYEIMLNEGDEISGKTRFNPQDIVFDLIEIDEDGNETMVVDAMSYSDFSERRIWVNTVNRNSTINKTYKLRMWLSEDVIISDTEDYADYTTSEFKNSYVSIKVSVYGDFVEKSLPYNYLANLGVEGSTFWPESIEAQKANITNVNFITMAEDLINNRYGVSQIKEDVTDVAKSNSGSVKVWLETNSDDSTKYTMYVASDGITFFPEDSSRMFNEFSVLESVLFENTNTKYATTIERMFRNCGNLLDVDVSGFDTSSVTNMSVMFQNCSKLTKLDVSKWDTSQVNNMLAMFNKCSGLAELDVSKWNTSNVTSMNSMFQYCITLVSLDVSEWDTSNVDDMTGMFTRCINLINLDVSNFNTSNVTLMEGMFYNCSGLINLDVSKWDTSNVTIMARMFFNCGNLIKLDVSKWDTSNVTNMSYMFAAGNDIDMSLTSLDLSGWDTSQVTTMRTMFQNCVNLENLDISNWNTSRVTDMSYMFAHCSKLKILDMSNLDTTLVTDTLSMFANCSNLVTIYSNSDWNSGNVTADTSVDMFTGCTNLVGATSYSNSNANDITFANSNTGYFTKKTI